MADGTLEKIEDLLGSIIYEDGIAFKSAIDNTSNVEIFKKCGVVKEEYVGDYDFSKSGFFELDKITPEDQEKIIETIAHYYFNEINLDKDSQDLETDIDNFLEENYKNYELKKIKSRITELENIGKGFNWRDLTDDEKKELETLKKIEDPEKNEQEKNLQKEEQLKRLEKFIKLGEKQDKIDKIIEKNKITKEELEEIKKRIEEEKKIEEREKKINSLLVKLRKNEELTKEEEKEFGKEVNERFSAEKERERKQLEKNAKIAAEKEKEITMMNTVAKLRNNKELTEKEEKFREEARKKIEGEDFSKQFEKEIKARRETNKDKPEKEQEGANQIKIKQLKKERIENFESAFKKVQKSSPKEAPKKEETKTKAPDTPPAAPAAARTAPVGTEATPTKETKKEEKKQILPTGNKKLSDFFDNDNILKKGVLRSLKPKPPEPTVAPKKEETKTKAPDTPPTEETKKSQPVKLSVSDSSSFDSGRENEQTFISTSSGRSIPSQTPEKKQMTWDDIEDIETFLQFLKDLKDRFSNITEEEIIQSYNDFYKNGEKNEFIEKNGGVGGLYEITQKGEKSFKQVIGFTPKEAHWWSSRENKVLAVAQETYDKNVDKINRLRNENSKLESKLDPFLGGGKGAILDTINEKGIHLSSTREKTVELFYEVRVDCIKDYFGLKEDNNGKIERPTPEQEEEFNKKTLEEKASIFQQYFNEHINEDRYNTFDNSTKNLLEGVLTETIGKPLKQIAINNAAIDATLEKNIDILKQTEPIVEKKKSKLEYKKAEREKPKVVKEELIDDIIVNKTAENEKKEMLKEKRKILDEKKKTLKETKFNKKDIQDRSKTFRKSVGDNVKVFNFDYQEGKIQMKNIPNQKQRQQNGGLSV